MHKHNLSEVPREFMEVPKKYMAHKKISGFGASCLLLGVTILVCAGLRSQPVYALPETTPDSIPAIASECGTLERPEWDTRSTTGSVFGHEVRPIIELLSRTAADAACNLPATTPEIDGAADHMLRNSGAVPAQVPADMAAISPNSVPAAIPVEQEEDVRAEGGSLHRLTPLSDRALCTRGTTLTVVAHQDDDILFINPDLAQDIADGSCMRTVYLTAGDAGRISEYWQTRERGSRAAYAHMYGMPNVWRDEIQMLPAGAVTVSYLEGAPNVALVFMRLPDGNLRGTGFEATRAESLQQLYDGRIGAVHTIDTGAAVTRQTLADSLYEIMLTDLPDHIRSLDGEDTANGDHSDHHSAGLFVELAAERYALQHAAAYYKGYPGLAHDSNLTEAQTAAKELTFLAYAQSDSAVCQSHAACSLTQDYHGYFSRLYPARTYTFTGRD